MPRLLDEPIPADELLYHRISPEHLDGDFVLEGGVEAPATSFNRGKYSKPEAVLSPRHPEQSEVAFMRAGNLPPPLERPEPPRYEFYAADDPNPPEDPLNDAHMEVRIRHEGQPYNPKHRPKTQWKQAARAALAEKMRRFIRAES